MTEIATAAYRLTTDGVISQAYPWQGKLYQRLSDPVGDIGGLLLAPLGAGKMESIVIPALGQRRGGAPRRLFLVGPDGSTLDDYLYRLVPYLRAFVLADETPRTLCLDLADESDEENVCRRFFPDGTEDPAVVTNPLEADVDLILTTFSHFRELFFGSGGVHALPAALIGDAPLRRDLFFFDEAHGYAPDAFSRFHRLIEFLFAEDMDVVVASSTLPPAFAEELGFLDLLPAPDSRVLSGRTLIYQPSTEPLSVIEAEIRRADHSQERVIAVTETSSDSEALHARLAASWPQSVSLYHPDQPAKTRRSTYARLRELEKQGEGYLLLTAGNELETSDLDATVLLSTLCPPENLIRRAGRCNRRGDFKDTQIIIAGNSLPSEARSFSAPQTADYLAALRSQSEHPFDPEFWKAFI